MEISEMDKKCATIAQTKAQVAELREKIEALEGEVEGIKNEVQEYFIESGREDPYVSPWGTLYLRSDISIKQPKGPALRALFEHFVKVFGEDMAWEKLSIHNATLKAELKDHLAQVEARGGDPVLEPLPGIEPPKTFKSLQFRKR